MITPFKAQAGMIRRELGRVEEALNAITVGTVHRLQGAERPIVIFSPTYNADSSAGLFFDRKPNMLNVAVSRARDSFVVPGGNG